MATGEVLVCEREVGSDMVRPGWQRPDGVPTVGETRPELITSVVPFSKLLHHHAMLLVCQRKPFPNKRQITEYFMNNEAPKDDIKVAIGNVRQ